MYETFWENCSHFILKRFQTNSFGTVCLGENYNNMQKIKILKLMRGPSKFDIREHTFKVICLIYHIIYKVLEGSIDGGRLEGSVLLPRPDRGQRVTKALRKC